MEEIKSIWNKLNVIQSELERLMDLNDINKVQHQLEMEEKIRKRFTPFMLPVVAITIATLGWLVYSNNEKFGLTEISGLIIIFVGGLITVYFPQMNRIPLSAFDYEQSSVSFYKIVKEKIQQKRKFFIGSICSLFVSLIIGLYLLIFGFESHENGGMVGVYFGFMFALAGIGIPSSIRMFDSNYKDLLLRIEKFISN